MNGKISITTLLLSFMDERKSYGFGTNDDEFSFLVNYHCSSKGQREGGKWSCKTKS